MNLRTFTFALLTASACAAQPTQPAPSPQPAAPASSQPTRESLEAAWQGAYEKKDFAAAADGLKALARFAPGDPIVRYNLACVLAQQGDIDGAELALRKCLELGFTDFPRLMNEKDLQPLAEGVVMEALRQGWRELQDTGIDHRLAQLRKTLATKNAKGEVIQTAEQRGYLFEKDDGLRLAYASGFSKAGHGETRAEIGRIVAYWQAQVLPRGEGGALTPVVVTQGPRPDPWVMVFLPNAVDYGSWAASTLGTKSDRVGGIYDNWKQQLVARDLGPTLRHEFWHALHWRHMSRLGQVHPVWVQEGLCSLIEDIDVIDEKTAASGKQEVKPVPSWRTNTAKRMVKSNLLPKLAALMTMDDKTYMGNRALGNYAASRAFFLWLAQQPARAGGGVGAAGVGGGGENAEGRTLLGDWYACYTADYPTDPTGKTTTERVLGKKLADLDKDFKAWLLSLPDVGEPNTPGLPTLPCDMQPVGGEGMVVIDTGTSDLLKNPLLKGDVIVAVDGHPVRDQTELARLLGTPAYKAGQTVTLKVRRDGRPFEAMVKLGRYE